MDCACAPNSHGQRAPMLPALSLAPKYSCRGVKVEYSSHRMYSSSLGGGALYPPVSPHQYAAESGVLSALARRISVSIPANVAGMSLVHHPGSWSLPGARCLGKMSPRAPLIFAFGSWAPA